MITDLHAQQPSLPLLQAHRAAVAALGHICWETIHSGPWYLVPDCWRDVYSLSALLSAALMWLEERNSGINDSRAAAKEAVKEVPAGRGAQGVSPPSVEPGSEGVATARGDARGRQPQGRSCAQNSSVGVAGVVAGRQVEDTGNNCAAAMECSVDAVDRDGARGLRMLDVEALKPSSVGQGGKLWEEGPSVTTATLRKLDMALLIGGGQLAPLVHCAISLISPTPLPAQAGVCTLVPSPPWSSLCLGASNADDRGRSLGLEKLEVVEGPGMVQFEEQWMRPQQPVLLSGVIHAWPALQRCVHLEQLT
jgi:hypothetical protein